MADPAGKTLLPPQIRWLTQKILQTFALNRVILRTLLYFCALNRVIYGTLIYTFACWTVLYCVHYMHKILSVWCSSQMAFTVTDNLFFSCCTELANFQCNAFPNVERGKTPSTVAIISLCSFCPRFFYLTSTLYPTGCLTQTIWAYLTSRPWKLRTKPIISSTRPNPKASPVKPFFLLPAQIPTFSKSKVYFDWPWVSSLAW